MNSIRVILFAVLSASFAMPVFAQDDSRSYPSDSEIQLMMGQVDRAMEQYDQVVKQEASLLGSSADTATDTKLLNFWKSLKAALAKDPQKFNSFAGFDIVVLIDDAARNAALISNTAATTALQQVTSGKVTSKTDLLVTLMQNANSSGTLLFTTAESATALYQRFLHWQDETLNESVTALNQCAGMLKKPGKP